WFTLPHQALARVREVPPPDARVPGVFHLSSDGALARALVGAGFQTVGQERVVLSQLAHDGAEFWRLMADTAGPLAPLSEGLAPRWRGSSRGWRRPSAKASRPTWRVASSATVPVTCCASPPRRSWRGDGRRPLRAHRPSARIEDRQAVGGANATAMAHLLVGLERLQHGPVPRQSRDEPPPVREQPDRHAALRRAVAPVHGGVGLDGAVAGGLGSDRRVCLRGDALPDRSRVDAAPAALRRMTGVYRQRVLREVPAERVHQPEAIAIGPQPPGHRRDGVRRVVVSGTPERG